MTERIPQELSSRVLEFEERLSSPSHQIRSVGSLMQMLVLGGMRMGANVLTGVQESDHYAKQRWEVTNKSYFEILQVALSRIGKPHAVSIDLTSDCNYGCRDCYRHAAKIDGYEPGEIDDDLYLERFSFVMDRFEKTPIFIMGGEPLLKAKRLNKVLEYAVEHDNPVKISSNLSVDIVSLAGKNEDYANLLKILQEHLDKITLMCSFEDSLPEYHDYLRREGGFDQSVTNVSKLIKAGVPIAANLIVNGMNYKRFTDMLGTFMEIGTNGVFVSFHTHVPRAKNSDPDYELTYERRAEASKLIAKALVEPKYGYFAKGITPEVARMMHPDELENVYSIESCPVVESVLSFDHRILPYEPCSFAGEVDCNTTHPEYGHIGCGLYIPALFAAAKRGEPGAIRQLMEESL